MRAALATVFIFVFIVINGQILLYDTMNNDVTEKFDCVYYVHDDGEEVAYCRRPDKSQRLNRKKNICENQGQRKTFHELLAQGIKPSDVLSWSSSIDMADEYANVFYNRSLIKDNDDRFVCNCIKQGTFGKYCEYQLTHNTTLFSQAIKAQFQQKENEDSWNTQRYGKIICYKTLPYDSSDLCLDWREICNGVQSLSGGIDEEHCDKLEFNECEEDEFRCTNGMCVAEEFWLDGYYDCMDWSDEIYREHGRSCSFEPNAIDCDEHICFRDAYSCGNGECVLWQTRLAFQRLELAAEDCYNKRNLNYMCEVSPHRRAWTLENGLCWSDENYNDPRYPPWNKINLLNVSDDEKCEYLFRCVLSDGFERDCPCSRHNCTQLMQDICPLKDLVHYPPKGLINPNFFFLYNYTQSIGDQNFPIWCLSGSVRCRGYHFTTTQFRPILRVNELINNPRASQLLLCTIHDPHAGESNFSSPLQYDKFCWNQSLTFNGRSYAVNPDICVAEGQCISKYRIHDGYIDCLQGVDEYENLEENHCGGNVGRHRFQCFNDEQKCLPLIWLGTGYFQCSNRYDEMWYGSDEHIRTGLKCWKTYTDHCDILRDYIGNPSIRNFTNNIFFTNLQEISKTEELPFRSYCDSFWDRKNHTDESTLCKTWICPRDKYQCQTGQCIHVEWVCDGEWDCADASDEEAIIIMKEWSVHNNHLFNLYDRLVECVIRYSQPPFFEICGPLEFGCYRSAVSNPLDIELNRPCINLTQIGDGVEDCYNAYDERNTFDTGLHLFGMWGFYLRCENDFIKYSRACLSKERANCTMVLCSNHRDKDGSCSGHKDVICLGNGRCKKNARCDGKRDCFYGEDEYWCNFRSLDDQFFYRYEKKVFAMGKPINSYFQPFPSVPISLSDQKPLRNSTVNFHNDSIFTKYSYQCNQGVAVLHMNKTKCLCPPAYYGDWCEFFSDRISIIAHIDQKTVPQIIKNVVLKIKANLLFENRIIDHHEFMIILAFENTYKIKHRFYLLYSRSADMLSLKRKRYFNRSDVIHNHPYCVHFDAFSIENNSIVRELGSWRYPIYFDYLPASPLAIVLRFPSWFGNTMDAICSEKVCNENSTCLPIFNANNSFYCSCKNGYYGRDCSMFEHQCATYCSTNALCRGDDNSVQASRNNPYCICPLNRFGLRCNLKYEDCDQNPCLNNGICLLTYGLSGEISFICNCSNLFHGARCEYQTATVHIDLNVTSVSSARASVVQLYDVTNSTVSLLIQYQRVYHGFQQTIDYYHGETFAPVLGLMKIYKELADPQYFIIYLLFETEVINITSPARHCPHVSSLANGSNSSDPTIFEYHYLCRNDITLFCFFDENFFCICEENNYRVECFSHNTQIDHCDKCLSGGKCIQGDLKDPNDFVCLCHFCYQGYSCEFNMRAFEFTLDSLLAGWSTKVKIVYVIIAFLLFIFGSFNNLCAFVTFRRLEVRQYAVGNYLLTVTCLNQVALLCLFLKFVPITFEFYNVGLCKAISYCLSTFTRSTYWLTSWVTIHRLLLIIFPTSVPLKNPQLAIKMNVATTIILFGMHVHEIIYYTIIENISTGSSICVTNFNSSAISFYNRVSTLIHYLFPFFIQMISITLLIFLITRSRKRTIEKNVSFIQMLKKQFRTQKELYVTPIIIILSALPQIIITFNLACAQLTSWQRHLLLGTYLLSYVPQSLGFILYVLPSTSYTNEFTKTFMGKNLFKWISSRKKNGISIFKMKK